MGPNSPADTHRFLVERLTPSADDYQLAVIVRGEVVGSAAVWVTDSANNVGELGYSLSAAAWGHGYATEAARALIGVGRDRLGLVRIAATCDVYNFASARVLEKVRMVREALSDRSRLSGRATRSPPVFRDRDRMALGRVRSRVTPH